MNDLVGSKLDETSTKLEVMPAVASEIYVVETGGAVAALASTRSLLSDMEGFSYRLGG